MKISFILPFIQLTGGVKSTFFLSLELVKRGHIVRLVYPTIPLILGHKFGEKKHLSIFVKRIKKTLLNWKKIRWFREIEPLLFPIPTLNNLFIPDGDIVVATAWRTAYYVASYKPFKGKKLYYVRDYEIWSGPGVLVDGSYKLPIAKITTSSTLENILSSKFGEQIVGRVPNGIDNKTLFNEPGIERRRERVLMQYSAIERKGIWDGVEAFEIAKKKIPEFKLVMFGNSSPSHITNQYEYHRCIYGAELRRLYCSSSIFLFSSRIEGWGMPPMEAMVCGCAVVATNTGGVPDYAIPNQTCLISPPSNPKDLTNNLIRLYEDTALRRKLASQGEKHIREHFTWKSSAKKFEMVLERLVSQS